MRILTFLCALSVLLIEGAPSSARADTITGDRILVDATDPSAVTVEHVLTWSAGTDAGDRKELVFHLARGVAVVGAEDGGVALSASSTSVRDSWLDRWTVKLKKPLRATESREIKLRTSVGAGDSPGIRIDAAGGVLGPGSGWIPAPTLESDELLPHRVAFRLPDGIVGVAAGVGSGGVWGTQSAIRPFAAWGAWTRSEHRRGEVDCVAYRRAAASGELPGTEDLEALIYALETGLGPAAGEGPWTFIDVGRGLLLGGARAVLWDEQAKRGPLHSRDLAGALANSYWTESLRFSGPHAALYGRAFPLYLGDVAAISMDPGDDRWRTYATVVGPRRDEFARSLRQDRPLQGVLPSDPAADTILRTRGVLVAHMTDATSGSSAHYIGFLRGFRSDFGGGLVDETVFTSELKRRFGDRSRHLPQFMDTTDLPDFVLGAHEVVTTKVGGKRLKVNVSNHGQATDVARLSAFSTGGTEMMQTELLLKPGQSRAVLFGDPELVARVEVDPRRRALQSAFTNESVALEPANPHEEVRPAFGFARYQHDLVWVTGLDLTLDGVTIRGFEGHAMWYETHHGPSGLLMMGNATVTVSPPAPHTDSFRQAMGRESVRFETPALWVRFPLGAWEQVSAALESAESRDDQPSEKDARFMFDHSFPTHFANGMRAEVPPPGGALAVFSLGGNERRGWVRDPKANGTVYARFWDQLRGVTLWEDTR